MSSWDKSLILENRTAQISNSYLPLSPFRTLRLSKNVSVWRPFQLLLLAFYAFFNRKSKAQILKKDMKARIKTQKYIIIWYHFILRFSFSRTTYIFRAFKSSSSESRKSPL